MERYMYVFDSAIGQFKIELKGSKWNLFVRDEYIQTGDDAERLARYAEINYVDLGFRRIGEPTKLGVPRSLDGWKRIPLPPPSA